MAETQTLTKERLRHTVRVFRHDPKQPTVAGKNPVQVDMLTIEHQTTMPRRERAAIEAVRVKCGVTASVGHQPGGDMVAIITAPGSMQPAATSTEQPAMLSDEAVRELLRSPTVLRELQRLANDPRVRSGK